MSIAQLPDTRGMRTATVTECVRNLATLTHDFNALDEPSAAQEQMLREVVERFMRLGLPHDRAPDGQPLLDLVELRNFINVADRAFGDLFWNDEAMPLGRRLMPSPSFDAPELAPAKFRLTLTRTYDRRFLKEGAACRLRLPVPLEDTDLSDLAVKLLAPAMVDVAKYSEVQGRLDVIVDPALIANLTVSAAYEFISIPTCRRGSVGRLDERMQRLALSPIEGLVRITPSISDLARKLADGETAILPVLKRFWEYLHAALEIGTVRHAELDTTDPLGSILALGWADCYQVSALLVALCRARGLPARLVGGYLLQPARPAQHYWIEVWSAELGWLPFDTLGFAVTRPGESSLWRDIYFGRIDHRARTECLPHLFTGMPGFRMPGDWHLNVVRMTGGMRTRLEDSRTGEAVYTEDVQCVRLS